MAIEEALYGHEKWMEIGGFVEGHVIVDTAADYLGADLVDELLLVLHAYSGIQFDEGTFVQVLAASRQQVLEVVLAEADLVRDETARAHDADAALGDGLLECLGDIIDHGR